ncbi:MAG: hypothetical protein R3281_11135 [Balneolaceae bacterium]|nr:hypothetical protein [Balneolaceae bacterium]
MADLPFDIPKSLSTYTEQFEQDPLTITTKLKHHLEKRGPDAVGYFLLAWFYHLKGMREQAIEHALKAKSYAPGSPLMEKLHYYLCHPDAFEAWTPELVSVSSAQKYRTAKGPEPVLDLDELIARLSRVDSTPIAIREHEPEKSSSNRNADHEVDDIASETLANIHEKQGKISEAINVYNRLKSIKKDKSEYYDEQIKRLREKAGNRDNE